MLDPDTQGWLHPEMRKRELNRRPLGISSVRVPEMSLRRLSAHD